MKLPLPDFLILVAFSFSGIVLPDPAAGSPGRPVLELLEQLSKTAGRAPAHGAAEALERAFAKEGAHALEAARRGGLGLPEAAAKHGDEVFRFAVRVPEAAGILAARADQVFPLARHFGDDFLRLEARVPGLGDDAVRIFKDPDAIRRLAALPPAEAREIVSFAHHAVDSKAPLRLLEAVEHGGPDVLRQLDPKVILALGLSTAMVIAASGGAVAAGTAPDQLFGSLGKLGIPISGSLALVLLAGGSVVVASLALRLGLWTKRPCQSQDVTNDHQ